MPHAKPYSSVEPEQPPVPPHLFGFGMQSTKVCGASDGSVPANAAADLSSGAVYQWHSQFSISELPRRARARRVAL
jgi:hypothetical protein